MPDPKFEREIRKIEHVIQETCQNARNYHPVRQFYILISVLCRNSNVIGL
jgi:hypothetical protein